jgi:hypothetical protein
MALPFPGCAKSSVPGPTLDKEKEERHGNMGGKRVAGGQGRKKRGKGWNRSRKKNGKEEGPTGGCT